MIKRMLDKDPEQRATIEEVSEHPWITQSGQAEALQFSESSD